ncbi:DUF488 domain-containing protein [Membranicola marinus]|uniref:DUF488 domain-containing protein n=1 Tax=Membranihabitans marinus TaxID=1227546 RepID=A0A953HMZ1_9BACT|nr:DUF488 domain-containing protein [Membranihabitans marinus]MBY5958069.1 DUF488 domain-containing protein [Membranihabitans marinus]
MQIKIKRIYDDKGSNDGIRILVDRLWPRGVSKEEANLDEWWKEIAPSDELRKWFDHDEDKWAEFKKKYKKELDDLSSELTKKLDELDLRKTIVLLYGAKDENHNQAAVLKEYLEEEV